MVVPPQRLRPPSVPQANDKLPHGCLCLTHGARPEGNDRKGPRAEAGKEAMMQWGVVRPVGGLAH
jgi:hypothetical protein